jgi:hypothetical protein
MCIRWFFNIVEQNARCDNKNICGYVYELIFVILLQFLAWCSKKNIYNYKFTRHLARTNIS